MHEPTVTRDGEWGPVTILCTCGKWTSDKDGKPVPTDVAWLRWESHHTAPAWQGMSGIGACYPCPPTRPVV
jgi:hypothetical protein